MNITSFSRIIRASSSANSYSTRFHFPLQSLHLHLHITVKMHISRCSLLYILASGSAVIAAPAGSICNPVDAVYALLRGPLKAQASSFCLSYLGGDRTVSQTQVCQNMYFQSLIHFLTSSQTQTVTGSGQTITVTGEDVTQQATAQATNYNTVTITDDVNSPNPVTTVTQTVTAGTRTIYQREADPSPAPALKIQIPPALSAFAAQRISSACSCIATPSTRTVVATATASVAGPRATATAQGQTVVVTVTQTVQITSTAEVTRTVPATATDTQQVATTVTPILVKPKICNAQGLPGANAFNYDANFNTNQANCIASCKTDNRCLSTGFYIVTNPTTGTSTGTCRKYDKSVTDSADLGPGYYNFNDKAC